ncbi:MAG: rhodanese-like domain-containing protein [bacterium]|nr:rhodanese-like domain-containing protein [bacterium]
MKVQPKNLVIDVLTEPPAEALERFESRFARETDCWDVHSTEQLEDRGFVLLDVRSKEAFDKGHLPGAVNIPHWTMTETRMSEYPKESLFVVYCAGPHCNGSTRAAIRLAKLGRPVKEMIGGTTGWVDEGFSLVTE